MKIKFLIVTSCAVAMLAGASFLPARESAQDPGMQQPPEMPEMPEPSEHHKWLKQLEGEWTTESEFIMTPGQAPQTSKGMETVRLIGGFWSISELKGDFAGMTFTGVMTLGYDSAKGKYIGTWIDSMTDYLWTYEGTLDDTGKTLTLVSEAPNPEDPSQTLKFRETIEIKSPDHRVFKSNVQGPDGQWFNMLTIDYRRKK